MILLPAPARTTVPIRFLQKSFNPRWFQCLQNVTHSEKKYLPRYSENVSTSWLFWERMWAEIINKIRKLNPICNCYRSFKNLGSVGGAPGRFQCFASNMDIFLRKVFNHILERTWESACRRTPFCWLDASAKRYKVLITHSQLISTLYDYRLKNVYTKDSKKLR